MYKRQLLAVRDVSLNFGGLRVLSDVTLEVRRREILAIIGPNGAGKTALLNCINGFYRPQRGQIYFEGQKIVGMRPDKIAALGIARTFQNIELYSGLSTLANIMAGRHVLMKRGFLANSIFFGWTLKEEVRHRKVAEEIIDFLELQAVRKNVVAVLPYGIRKRVELGRALAMEPKVLLLDEPLAGMNIEEKEDMARFILDIFEGQQSVYNESFVLKNGVNSIVLVEHDMGVVMDIADRVVVLDFGRKIAEGSPAEIKNNPQVIKAYLGESG